MIVSPIGSTGRRRAGGARRRSRCARSGRARPEGRSAVAVGRPGALLEARQVRQGCDEGRLGGVLRGVMVAELVVGVGIHAGEVPAIQGVELGRITLRGQHQRSVLVEMREPGDGVLRRSHSPQCPARHFVTPRLGPRRRIGDAESRPRARVAAGPVSPWGRTSKAPESVSTSTAVTVSAVPSGHSRRTGNPFVSWRSRQSSAANLPARRSSTNGSSRARNAAATASRPTAWPSAASESDVMPAANSAGKLARAQSTLIPMPMTACGCVGPEALGLAEDAGHLAGAAIRAVADDEVVRPLQADGPALAGAQPPRRPRPSRATRSPRAATPARAPATLAESRRTAKETLLRAPTTLARCARGRPAARRRSRRRPPACPRAASRRRCRSSSRRRRTTPCGRASRSPGRRRSERARRLSPPAGGRLRRRPGRVVPARTRRGARRARP